MNGVTSHLLANINLKRGRLCVCSAMLLLGGCNASLRSHEIVVIPLFSTENLASCEHVGMDEAVAGTDFHLAFNGPSDGDAQRQIDLFNEAIGKRAYGIAINPRSLYAANGVIRNAVTQEIPVVVLLHPLPLGPEAHLSFVLEDVSASAELVSQRLKHILPERSDVLLVGLDSLNAGGEDRFVALEESMQRIDPSARIVGRIAGQPVISAFQSAITDALARQPGIRAIVALDSHAGYAAASVVHDLNAQSNIRILAFDQNTEVLASLRQGGVDSVLVQDMREIGHIAIANMIRDHHHQSVAPVTYVKPLLVTRDNIDSERVQQILLMNWTQP
jgi:ABC-type sugar transport system substrate-binding protein